MPAQEGIVEQVALGHYAKLHGQSGVKTGDIQCRKVVDGVDVGFRGVEVFETGNLKRAERRLEDHAGPESGKSVLDATVAVEERRQQRQATEDSGVEIDQRIEEE